MNAEIPVPVDSVLQDISHPAVIKRKRIESRTEVANGLFSVDLTPVTQNEEINQIKHELELEVKES